MTEATEQLLLDSIERLFRAEVSPQLREAASEGRYPSALFAQFEQSGYLSIGQAAAGLPPQSMFRVLTLAGRHAVPGPLAERLLAACWLPELSGTGARITLGWRGSPEAPLLAPWGRWADWVLELPCFAIATLADEEVVLLRRVERIEETLDPFRQEPLDRVEGPVSASMLFAQPWLQVALGRASLMAGALETLLALSLRYVSEREQFGRPLARFQAIQQQLAVLAGEVAAAQVTVANALVERGDSAALVTGAAAKARLGEAAGVAADLAQQVHGAMGYTREHELHQFTTRLWRWREEAGHEAEWQQWLGQRVAHDSPLDPWAFIVKHS